MQSECTFVSLIQFQHTIGRYTYETLLTIADYLLERTALRPRIGIICGSGLGSLAEQLVDTDVFPYESIPNFPISTVEGHAGRMIFGHLGGVPVMCMQGRFHYYEGYGLAKVIHNLRYKTKEGGLILDSRNTLCNKSFQ